MALRKAPASALLPFTTSGNPTEPFSALVGGYNLGYGGGAKSLADVLAQQEALSFRRQALSAREQESQRKGQGVAFKADALALAQAHSLAKEDPYNTEAQNSYAEMKYAFLKTWSGMKGFDFTFAPGADPEADDGVIGKIVRTVKGGPAPKGEIPATVSVKEKTGTAKGATPTPTPAAAIPAPKPATPPNEPPSGGKAAFEASPEGQAFIKEYDQTEMKFGTEAADALYEDERYKPLLGRYGLQRKTSVK